MFNAKKIATSIAAAALMMGVSTSAFAAFGNMDLIRVVLDNAGTVEIATDLGDVNTVLAGGTFGGDANAFTAQTGGTKAGLNVTYFAVNQATKELWISGDALKISAGKSVTITALSTNLWNYYNTITPAGSATTTVVADASSGYHVQADGTTQFGQFATAITPAGRPSVEASLSSLATASVVQSLYYFKDYSKASTGVLVGSLTTNSLGATTVPTSSTPIPAAIYLMGSGLLGLVGVRRRKNA